MYDCLADCRFFCVSVFLSISLFVLYNRPNVLTVFLSICIHVTMSVWMCHQSLCSGISMTVCLSCNISDRLYDWVSLLCVCFCLSACLSVRTRNAFIKWLSPVPCRAKTCLRLFQWTTARLIAIQYLVGHCPSDSDRPANGTKASTQTVYQP